MKRILGVILFGLISVVSVTAQIEYRMVKGCVIDKNGNPIAGAEVIATGGGESVLTDADGSFRLSVHPYLKSLTASYTGFKSKTMKTRFGSDMIFTLKLQNTQPGFLNVLGGVNYNDCGFSRAGVLGLMGGQLGKWGYYAKVMTHLYEGDMKTISGTVGVIKSFYRQNSYLYLGAGYSYYSNELMPYWWSRHNYNGFAIDLGYILRPCKHFNLNIGATLNCLEGLADAVFHAGVGYVF